MVMGTPCSGPHTCLRPRARSAARARLRAPSTSMAMMALVPVLRLGGDHHQLFNSEKAVLVHIAEEEGLDHRLMKLLSVDLAVAVRVVLPHPRLGIRRRRRLRAHATREGEHAQHRGDPGPRTP